MLRFELNQALTFHNVKEEQWGSIYRRSLVIKMKARFIPSEEYNELPLDIKSTKGVFPKDDTLKKFLESRQADGAFFKLIYAFMNKFTIEDCRKMIDDYARNEGDTWEVMRGACGLDEVAPPTDLEAPKASGAAANRIARLTRLSDALAAVALENDTDVQRTHASLGALWKKLAPPTLPTRRREDTTCRAVSSVKC